MPKHGLSWFSFIAGFVFDDGFQKEKHKLKLLVKLNIKNISKNKFQDQNFWFRKSTDGLSIRVNRLFYYF